MNKKIRQTLADNLEALMDFKEWNATKLSEKAPVGESSINYYKSMAHSCTVDKLDFIASAFKQPAWALLVPELTCGIPKQELVLLMQYFMGVTADGRSAILRLARSEAMLADPSSPLAHHATGQALPKLIQ